MTTSDESYTAGNKGFAIAGVPCFADSFVLLISAFAKPENDAQKSSLRFAFCTSGGGLHP